MWMSLLCMGTVPTKPQKMPHLPPQTEAQRCCTHIVAVCLDLALEELPHYLTHTTRRNNKRGENLRVLFTPALTLRQQNKPKRLPSTSSSYIIPLMADELATHSKLTCNYGEPYRDNPQHCGLVGFGNRETNLVRMFLVAFLAWESAKHTTAPGLTSLTYIFFCKQRLN